MKKILYAVFSIMLLASCGDSKRNGENDKNWIGSLVEADVETPENISRGKQRSYYDDKNEIRSQVRAEIEAADEVLRGKQVDFMTVCDRAVFVNDEVHYYYTIDEDYKTIEEFRGIAGEIKSNIRAVWESIPEVEELLSKLEQIGGRMVVHYKGNYSGETLSITVYDF